MFFNFLFKHWPLHKQIAYLRRKGILIGTRTKDSRKVFIYMHNDLFAEIIYKNDDPQSEVEHGNIVRGLQNLNTYLEKEFRTSF